MKIAGAVVLYKPEVEVIQNIKSYLPYVDRLFIIDNSEIIKEEIRSKLCVLPKVEYIAFGENRGIATALNCALQHADSFEWLLTMDQDSHFGNGDCERYLQEVETLIHNEPKAALAGLKYTGGDVKSVGRYQAVDAVITSGSLVNVAIAIQAGGFDESLFIDEVDQEFCYRLASLDYSVFRINTITLIHQLGRPFQGIILGRKLVSGGHSVIRKYYIARNKVYVARKYPCVRSRYWKELIKLFIKMLLLEPGRIKNIKYIFWGIWDGMRGRMGKMKE